MVLGDGRTVCASAEENVDLFNALPWSHGSLGFVVGLEISIIPAQPYVHITYHAVHSIEETCALMEREACRADPSDFVEGILFSAQEGVVMTGVFAEIAASAKVHRANRWYAPWFAARSRCFIAEGGGDEFIPLTHFYRRHMRGMYWESELIVPFGNHPLFRVLFGWMPRDHPLIVERTRSSGLYFMILPIISHGRTDVLWSQRPQARPQLIPIQAHGHAEKLPLASVLIQWLAV
ncbi:MAG: hypothetical protein ACREXT_03660 [Gammaproteobacteria bacterium]